MGPSYLRQFMSQAQWAAYAKNPAAGSRFLGNAVHDATNAALKLAYGNRFQYNRIGPDFLDTLTGQLIELTTQGQIGAHLAKGGLYDIAAYATYFLP
jgi:hypothetical protein